MGKAYVVDAIKHARQSREAHSSRPSWGGEGLRCRCLGLAGLDAAMRRTVLCRGKG